MELTIVTKESSKILYNREIVTKASSTFSKILERILIAKTNQLILQCIFLACGARSLSFFGITILIPSMASAPSVQSQKIIHYKQLLSKNEFIISMKSTFHSSFCQ